MASLRIIDSFEILVFAFICMCMYVLYFMVFCKCISTHWCWWRSCSALKLQQSQEMAHKWVFSSLALFSVLIFSTHHPYSIEYLPFMNSKRISISICHHCTAVVVIVIVFVVVVKRSNVFAMCIKYNLRKKKIGMLLFLCSIFFVVVHVCFLTFSLMSRIKLSRAGSARVQNLTVWFVRIEKRKIDTNGRHHDIDNHI